MKTFYSIIVCLLLTIGFTQAQETAAEWLSEAETALAEGRLTDAGSAYSNAAHKQMESGDYEAAAENFKKAAEQFRKDGRIAQAGAETTNAAGAYETAAKKAAENGDHGLAAELYEKAAEQYDADDRTAMAEGARRNAENERQHLIEISVARGTGRTTGHIATLSVTNNSDAHVTVTPQTFYIPSDNRYQSYFGRIPSPVEVDPGESMPIEITGYCTDVTKPPSNVDLPPIEDWVAVSSDGIPHTTSPPVVGDPPVIPEPMNPPGGSTPPAENQVKVITENVVPPFSNDHIPEIIDNPGFTPDSTKDDQDLIVTWPGTDIPVDGIIDPNADPTSIAPVIVSIVESIEKASEIIQNDTVNRTPFSNSKDREIEALTQQTIWIVMAEITGEDYQKSDFAENTYEQFSNVKDIPVASIPEKVKENLDEGVDDFWDAFMAVGVKAKVFKAEENNEVTSDEPVYPDSINDLVAYFDPANNMLIADPEYLIDALTALNAESVGKGSYKLKGKGYSGNDIEIEFKVSLSTAPEIFNIAEQTDVMNITKELVNEFTVGSTSYRVYKNAECGAAEKAFISHCQNLEKGKSSQREWFALRKCTSGKGFCTEAYLLGGYEHVYEFADCKGPKKSSKSLFMYQCWQ